MENELFLQTHWDAPRVYRFASGHVAVFSRRHPLKDGANEDAVGLIGCDGGGVLVVADGCGGMAQGDLAAAQTVETLQLSIREERLSRAEPNGHPDDQASGDSDAPDPDHHAPDAGGRAGKLAGAGDGGDSGAVAGPSRVIAAAAMATVPRAEPPTSLRGVILDGIERANALVQQRTAGAGATLAVVEITPQGVMRPYHVGDCQILVVGNRGRLKLLTRAHSPVGYAQDSGLISEHEALRHQDRHLVSNIVGNPQMHIEIGPRLRLAPRDTVLVASDGLFDNLHSREIINLIRKGPLAGAAGALASTIRQRMEDPRRDEPSKPDDVSFVIYRGPPRR